MSFFDLFFDIVFFEHFWDLLRFLIHFGTPWGSHFRPFGHHFSILFSTSFSTPFLNGFLMDFGTIFDHFFNTFLYRFGFSRFSWKWHHYGTRARFLWFQHHDFSWFFDIFFDFFRHWFLHWFLIDFLMDFGSILDTKNYGANHFKASKAPPGAPQAAQPSLFCDFSRFSHKFQEFARFSMKSHALGSNLKDFLNEFSLILAPKRFQTHHLFPGPGAGIAAGT